MEDYVFRDPDNHIEEIQAAYDQYKALLSVYTESPREINKKFLKLLYDLSHIIYHHDFCKEFANKTIAFLETHPESLPANARSDLIQAILVLHTHNVLTTEEVLNHLMPMMRLNDKVCRRIIYGHFYNFLPHHQTNSTKKELQKFVYHEDSRVSFKALQLIVDIFHKENIEDIKTINFIARCLSLPNTRLANIIVSFFLDPYIPQVKDEADPEEEVKQAELSLKVTGKTRSRQRKLEKAKKMKASLPQDPVQVISFIDDPQKFAFRLFALLSAPENSKVFKVRESQLRALSLLSRIISTFQLDFDQFFNWSQRFIRPNYDDVTKMLAIVASAVHPLTSPDTLEELLKVIADRFITDYNDEEVVVVGLNTIREICSRNPHGMPDTLLSELCEYKNQKIKGVVMAARSIIQLYREVMPAKLPKRERGKPEKDENGNTVTKQDVIFGQQRVDTGVKGAEGIDMERPITEEEFQKIMEGKALENDEDDISQGKLGVEVDEGDLISRVRRSTKEEMVATAQEGKPGHHKKFSYKDDKTGGFSNKDKLKFKDFRLTRFSHNSHFMKAKSLKSVQVDRLKREAKLKAKMMN